MQRIPGRCSSWTYQEEADRVLVGRWLGVDSWVLYLEEEAQQKLLLKARLGKELPHLTEILRSCTGIEPLDGTLVGCETGIEWWE